jgi:hypothetical protein
MKPKFKIINDHYTINVLPFSLSIVSYFMEAIMFCIIEYKKIKQENIIHYTLIIHYVL